MDEHTHESYHPSVEFERWRLRMVLVGLVAGLGLTLPTGKQIDDLEGSRRRPG